MQIAIVPILLFGAVAIAVAVVIVGAGYLFNPGRQSRVKEMPYESGMDPIHDTHRRFDIRFHLLAIAFLVFDVELLFLYPWAVASHVPPPQASTEVVAAAAVERKGVRYLLPERPEGCFAQKVPDTFSLPMTSFDAAVSGGLIENRGIIFTGVMIFIALVTLGFVYDWRKGIFDWR